MADHVYSISEIVGSSTESIDDAIKGSRQPRLGDPAQPGLVRGHRDAGQHRGRRALPLPGHREGRLPARRAARLTRTADHVARLGSRGRAGGEADGRGSGRRRERGADGPAAAGPDRRPGPDDHLRGVRGAGRGDRDAGGRPGSRRPAPVRLGVQRVHAGQRDRHRGRRPGGGPARTRGAVRGRGGAVRLRPGRGGPGALDGRAGRGPGAAGRGRRSGALGGVRRDRPEPARAAAGPHDGGAVHRVGRAGAGRPGDQRRGGAPVRVAVGVPGPAADRRGGRGDRGTRPGPARAARFGRGGRAPDDRRLPHRGGRDDAPGRPDARGGLRRGPGRLGAMRAASG